MATVVRMPGISADAGEADLVEWAVAVGDTVRKGDVIATVETDKAVVDIEAEEDGTVLTTLASAGESVAIGGAMAVLLQAGEQASDEASILAALGLGPAAAEPQASSAEARPEVGPQASGPIAAVDEDRSQDELVEGAQPPILHTADGVVASNGSTNGSTNGGGRVFATPLVRRLASEVGMTLDGLRGTGPNGRIRRRDLEAAQATATQATPVAAPTPVAVPVPAPAAPASPAPSVPATVGTTGYTDEPATRFRRSVAAALTASKQNVPHFYLKATCRVDALLALRAELNAAGTTKITVNDFIVKAAAVAMQRVPEMNVIWTGEAVRRFDSVDIAVAMATERGLVVPVVRSAETRSLSNLSATVKDLAARAGANTLNQRELEGGTLAISNLGMYGVEEFTAIINPPQVGILAVGAASPQAVEGPDGALVLARCLKITLSVDHRPVDGALAAQWLQQLKTVLENPLQIVV